MRSLRLIVGLLLVTSLVAQSKPLDELVHHGFLKNGEVKLHYASLGKSGPLVVMLHGYPDYWYTWRHQMPELATDHHVVAIDLRGYNRSDKPDGIEHYAWPKLLGDVAAVIRHFGHEKAILVGHDWGGAIAWQVAMRMPRRVSKLAILNIPHPRGFFRELRENPTQAKNSQYARDFQNPKAHEKLTAELLAGWVKDRAARRKYVEAFRRSDFKAMLAYYKSNYPKPPATPQGAAIPPMPPVKCPTLVIHGLADKYLLASGLSGTWDWVDAELTLVTIPKAGHFVQHDASDRVTRSLAQFLRRDGAP